MTDYSATCPVHGAVDAQQMEGAGWRCMEEDEDRPHGICNRTCNDPTIASTGEPLGKTEGRKCEQCGFTMNGEYRTALRCKACRKAMHHATWAKIKRDRAEGAPSENLPLLARIEQLERDVRNLAVRVFGEG